MTFSDPSISTAAAAILEKLVNHALRYDPATQIKLRRLDNNVIAIKTRNPTLECFITTLDHTVELTAHHAAPVDATIEGDFLDFIRLGQGSHSFAESSLHVNGKSGLLTELQDILQQLEIDWEEAISDILGIVPGQLVATAIRQSFTFLHSGQKQIEAHLADYLSEELRAIPNRVELDQYYQSVDVLTADLNRLEARVNRLLSNPKS